MSDQCQVNDCKRKPIYDGVVCLEHRNYEELAAQKAREKMTEQKDGVDAIVDETIETLKVWIDKGRKLQAAVDEILKEHQTEPEPEQPKFARLSDTVVANLEKRALMGLDDEDRRTSISTEMLLSLLTEVRERRAE